MPAVETHMPPKPDRPRVNRATLDPMAAALLESQDDNRDMLREELRSMRDEFKQEIRGFKRLGWAAMGGFFVLQVLYVVVNAQLLGVDVRETAAATREIVSATTSTTVATDATGDATATTTTTTTTPAIEPTAEPE